MPKTMKDVELRKFTPWFLQPNGVTQGAGTAALTARLPVSSGGPPGSGPVEMQSRLTQSLGSLPRGPPGAAEVREQLLAAAQDGGPGAAWPVAVHRLSSGQHPGQRTQRQGLNDEGRALPDHFPGGEPDPAGVVPGGTRGSWGRGEVAVC